MKLLTRELLAQVESLQMISRRRTHQRHRGEKVSRRKGSSLEFSDFREYLQGDDIRSIDWNAYARTEKLFLKLFFEEEGRPVYFLVDASESMNFGDPTKYEYARALASALSYVCLRRYDRPSVLLLQDRNFTKFSFASQKQYFPQVSQIEKLAPAGETHISAVLRKIALSRFPRGIYVLLSDFYSYDGFEAMGLLAASGNELHCFQILSPEETNPGRRGDLKLIDSETAAQAEVTMSPQILRRYQARLEALRQQVRETAHRSQAIYYGISSGAILSDFIQRDLRRLGVVS